VTDTGFYIDIWANQVPAAMNPITTLPFDRASLPQKGDDLYFPDARPDGVPEMATVVEYSWSWSETYEDEVKEPAFPVTLWVEWDESDD